MTIPEPAPPRVAAGFLRHWLPWILGAVAVMWLAFLADSHVAGWLGESRPKSLKNAARLVSFYGDWPPLVIGAALVAGIGLLVRRRCTRIVCLMIIAASLAGLGANVSRALTGRTRPSAKIEQGWYGPTLGRDLGVSQHSVNSFPSAHTSSAMGFFFALVLLAPRIGFALLPAAFLVGFSRIYLSVHHFSDVVGGLILGTAAAMFTCWVLAPRWDAYRNRRRALAAEDSDLPVEQTSSLR